MARKSNEFEKAFQHLETIVKRLESEEMPLDESLQLFEEGIRLSRFCNQKLEEVEKKIELILADAKGQPRIEPFESEELDEQPRPPRMTRSDHRDYLNEKRQLVDRILDANLPPADTPPPSFTKRCATPSSAAASASGRSSPSPRRKRAARTSSRCSFRSRRWS